MTEKTGKTRPSGSPKGRGPEVDLKGLMDGLPGARVAVAESCTGGLVGGRITEVPGSSGYFAGGIVAYSNDVKRGLLGVKASTLEKFGAVSAETAVEMAEGARKRLKADYGLSVTGIAGPGGGSAEKPVGTVFIAAASEDATRVIMCRCPGTRKQVRSLSVGHALGLLVDFISSEGAGKKGGPSRAGAGKAGAPKGRGGAKKG